MDSNDTISSFLPKASIYTSVTILTFVCLVTSLVNVMLLIVVCHEKRLRRPLYILLVNFFVSEIVFVMFMIPLNVATLIKDSLPFGYVVCYFQAYITYGALSTSGCVLASISVYRVFQVCFYNKYLTLVQRKWIVIVCFACWVIPIAICVGLGGTVRFEVLRFSCLYTGPYFLTVLVSCLYVPLVIIVLASYLKIYLHTRKSKQRIQAQMQEPIRSMSLSVSAQRSDDVLFKMMLLVFVEFLFFYIFPGALNYSYGIADSHAQSHISMTAFMLYRVRPIVNCITCVLTNGELRTVLKSNFKYITSVA